MVMAVMFEVVEVKVHVYRLNPVVTTVVEPRVQDGADPPVMVTERSLNPVPLAIAKKLKEYWPGVTADVKLVTCAPPTPLVPVTTCKL